MLWQGANAIGVVWECLFLRSLRGSLTYGFGWVTKILACGRITTCEGGALSDFVVLLIKLVGCRKAILVLAGGLKVREALVRPGA